MSSQVLIGDYLVNRLYELGVRHVFGVAGDYALLLFDKIEHSPMKLINTCDEQGAGFAADAYARIRGLGVVCVTYGVGGLKLANSTAMAFAEESPVVVVSGAPGVQERQTHRLLHHKVHDYDTQRKVFEQFTVANVALDDPRTAISEIERALSAALAYKRPVYIELPRDMVLVPANVDYEPHNYATDSDPEVLREALEEAVGMIDSSRKPVILADVEMHRFGLQDELVMLAEGANIPVASMMMGKSAMAESHPLFLGIYAGAIGQEAVRDYVESSDCFILLGAHLTDFNLGMYTSHIDKERSIHATSHNLSIRRHSYEGVKLGDFVRGLIDAGIQRRELGEIPHPPKPQPFFAVAGQALTLNRLFQRLNALLDDNTMVISDIGESLWGSLDLFIRQPTEFLASACYGSLGFAVPAAVGAQMANPKLRSVVVVGDGAFQMTGMELSTVARYSLNPIVIVVNNNGYGTERQIMDGPFNDIQPWRYGNIPDVLGAGRGFAVSTEDELEEALNEARTDEDSFFIIDAAISPHDRSQALQRLAEGTPAVGMKTE